jgi:hypothetical protein
MVFLIVKLKVIKKKKIQIVKYFKQSIWIELRIYDLFLRENFTEDFQTSTRFKIVPLNLKNSQFSFLKF